MTAVEFEIELNDTVTFLLEEMLDQELTDETLEQFVEQLIREKIIEHHVDLQR